MNDASKFRQEKSALLTALAAQVQSCKYTLEAVRRLHTTAPEQPDDTGHLETLLDDLHRLTEALRDATDGAT